MTATKTVPLDRLDWINAVRAMLAWVDQDYDAIHRLLTHHSKRRIISVLTAIRELAGRLLELGPTMPDADNAEKVAALRAYLLDQEAMLLGDEVPTHHWPLLCSYGEQQADR